MKCPVDETVLVMSERSGIEIDYCPQCRGVWLDRGELDKIVDRAAAEQAPAPAAQPQQPYMLREQPYAQPYDAHRTQPPQQPYRRKKKEHWLSELFD